MVAKIDANDKRIAELKANMVNEKKTAQADYKKKIDDLEKRNRALKAKIDGYEGEGKENWENFKAEFNHDMDQFGQAFKDIGVRNTK
jgi:TolA-binding protein